MIKASAQCLIVGMILALGACAYAQEVGSRVPQEAASGTGAVGGSSGTNETGAEKPGQRTGENEESSSKTDDQEESDEKESKTKSRQPMSLHERLGRVLSQDEDDDGPINTDRPTFTPANTVVPLGRLQFESGWTFNAQSTSRTRSSIYDFPELALRYGLMDRVEFRMYWLGQTFSQTQPRQGGSWRSLNGPSDMEVGFKWQLFPGDEKRKCIPTTALITSIIAPTGGTSPFSSETVEPYINLIYGWSVTKKLTLAGSTGDLGIRQKGSSNLHLLSDNYQRYHQSIVAFYSPDDRITLFYEWYALMFTNASDNRPTYFMDGGLLYRITPNMQIDVRAGFGLTGRPDDFFTGTGFSIRF